MSRFQDWAVVRDHYEGRFIDTIQATVSEIEDWYDSATWELHNEDYSEGARDSAANELNDELIQALKGIPSYNTIIENHIREIVARRMDKVIEKHEDKAYGDDPLYWVVSRTLDDLYASIIE